MDCIVHGVAESDPTERLLHVQAAASVTGVALSCCGWCGHRRWEQAGGLVPRASGLQWPVATACALWGACRALSDPGPPVLREKLCSA